MSARPVRRAHGHLDAAVDVPGSKSITNRALVCAALAGGTSVLRRVAPGDDTVALVAALRALGLDVDQDGDVLEVAGRPPERWATGVTLHAGLAGTTSRFLTALVALSPGPITVDGDEPLRQRPMGPLHDALRELGARIEASGDGRLPVTVGGPLGGSSVAVSGDVSSQFLTAVMLVAPYLGDGVEIRLTTRLVSRPYVEMTARVMAAFGVTGVVVGDDRVIVPPGRYHGTEYDIEPDASSASYPLAAAAIRGGTVRVPGLGPGSLQGDAAFADLLGEMGAIVQRDAEGTTVTGAGELRGLGEVDLADMSDLVPTLAVTAAFASTPTRIRGVGFIRAKESDRIGDLAAELRRLGVDVHEHEDGLDIVPGDEPRGARLGTHHDHRLAMALSLAGLRVGGIEIEDPAVVRKSWPGWWAALEALTPRVEVAAFDVDGTLTKRDSMVPFLWRTARWGLVSGLARRPWAVLSRLARRDRDGLKALAARATFRGRGVAGVEADGQQYAAHLYDRALRHDVLERLRWHRDRGDRVVLVSASLGPYLHPLGETLGVAAVLCTELELAPDGRTYSGELVGGNCRAQAKVDRLEAWLAAQGLDDATIWAYGDSAGDDALLARATHAHRVRGVQLASAPEQGAASETAA